MDALYRYPGMAYLEFLHLSLRFVAATVEVLLFAMDIHTDFCIYNMG